MKRLLVMICACALLLCGGCSTVNEVSLPTEVVTEAPTPAQTVPPTEPPTEPPSPSKTAEALLREIMSGQLQKKQASVEVPEMYQYPELPTGCESIALTIAINSYGYELTKTDIADKYLVYGDNYATSFVGDPHGQGGSGIYPPGLVKTVENFAEDTGAGLFAFDLTGTPLDDLYKLIETGNPVIVWTTVYMNWPYFESGLTYNGTYYPWYDTEHCVTLYGYNKGTDEVSIADPQRGRISVDATQFGRIYDEIGRFAMALIQIEE